MFIANIMESRLYLDRCIHGFQVKYQKELEEEDSIWDTLSADLAEVCRIMP